MVILVFIALVIKTATESLDTHWRQYSVSISGRIPNFTTWCSETLQAPIVVLVCNDFIVWAIFCNFNERVRPGFPLHIRTLASKYRDCLNAMLAEMKLREAYLDRNFIQIREDEHYVHIITAYCYKEHGGSNPPTDPNGDIVENVSLLRGLSWFFASQPLRMPFLSSLNHFLFRLFQFRSRYWLTFIEFRLSSEHSCLRLKP